VFLASQEDLPVTDGWGRVAVLAHRVFGDQLKFLFRSNDLGYAVV
jgi:hypothetical protein